MLRFSAVFSARLGIALATGAVLAGCVVAPEDGGTTAVAMKRRSTPAMAIRRHRARSAARVRRGRTMSGSRAAGSGMASATTGSRGAGSMCVQCRHRTATSRRHRLRINRRRRPTSPGCRPTYAHRGSSCVRRRHLQPTSPHGHLSTPDRILRRVSPPRKGCTASPWSRPRRPTATVARAVPED